MKTILVVDDHREVQELLEHTLARKGYKILGVRSGQEALTSARNEKPDLIIMDIGMPGPVDGLQATQMLKSYPETRHAKVIVLTGTEDPMAPQESSNAGADAFFTKPFSPVGLLRKIDELL